MRFDGSFALLLLCFFLSGLAGLIYETAWTREFSFVFGTSSLAVATVLAAYMAGLGAGAAAASRFAHRITRPILAYGVLELGIAVTALAIPFAVQASRSLYVALFGGQLQLPNAGGLGSGLFYAACSFAILMVPTAMMGATLPLLARFAVRSEGEITGRIGVLYAVNTAGAVAGTLVAAFALLPNIGLRNTIWAAASVNAVVFLAAWALARRAPTTAAAPAPKRLAALGAGALVLPLIFGSGAVSFSYEVLWVRMLDHLLDGSSYSFATMLASFLTGIAAGAALASRLGRTRDAAALGFALAQLGTAALSLLAYLGMDRIPALTGALMGSGLSITAVGAIASMLTLFPGAVCIGATFPFAVRVLARDGQDAGPASARVYAANTLGSIVGSLGAGFFVIPWLGYLGTITLCVGANLVLAAGAAWLSTRGRRALWAASGLGLLGLTSLPLSQPWNVLLSGVDSPLEAPGEVVYAGVGRTATVLLRETVGRWKLVTNGVPEATIDSPGVWHGAVSTPRWIASLPVLARPELEHMLLIGLGGGVSLEAVPPSVKQVSVVELEPHVVAANRAVGPLRWRDPLEEERVSLQVNDARNALLLSDMRFGAIVSQPSHPWRGGAAHLYTREFFELAHSRLEPDGVLVQWMGQQFIDEELFSGFLATLHSVFGFVRVYTPSHGSAVIFVASNAPLDLERTAGRAIAANPESFAELGIEVAEDVTARLLLDERGARNLAREGIPNRDDYNRLQIRSSRVGERALAGRLEDLYGALDPLAELRRSELDPFLLLERVDPRRAARLAGLGSASLRMPLLEGATEHALARAIVELAQDGGEEARLRLTEALARAPEHPFGRAALLRSRAREIGEGLDAETLVQAPLESGERALVDAWSAGREAGPERGASIEAALGSVPRRHPLYRDAQRERARWRIESGDAGLAREALAILDRVLVPGADDLLLRARACLAAGLDLATLDTLNVSARSLQPGSANRDATARSIRELASRVAERPEHQRLRTSLEAVLQRSAGQVKPSPLLP